MADLNASRQQAASTLGGWRQAELVNRDAARTSAKNALSQIDPYYTQLFDDLSANQTKAQSGLVASMARRGLTRSGLRTRAEGNLAGEYGKLNYRLGEEKRVKTDEMTNQYNAADKLYNNLETEFQDKVNALALDLYNKALANEATIAAARASAASYGGGSTGSAATPKAAVSPQDAAADRLWNEATQYAVSGAFRNPYDTEKNFIPAMIAKYKRLGLDSEFIKEVVYDARRPYENQRQPLSAANQKSMSAINNVLGIR